MNRKSLLVIALIVISIIAIVSIIFNIRLINIINEFPLTAIELDGGTVPSGKQALIDKIKSCTDAESRKKQADFAVQCNILTQDEANSLY